MDYRFNFILSNNIAGPMPDRNWQAEQTRNINISPKKIVNKITSHLMKYVDFAWQ